ncbi:MAG: hypothetical protein LBH17_04460 [Oscillospiraceae bacterium]|jgi:hypothetical protein|nr:hypothetical protein [Oscillospiraceae bacterium]
MSNNYDDARLSAERHNDFYEYKRLGEPEKYAIITYQKKMGAGRGNGISATRWFARITLTAKTISMPPPNF